MAARWNELEEAAPVLGAAARSLFDRYELVVLATNRASGFPRLSLVEPVLLDGDLVIGTSTGDAKTRDLRADPRCSLHCLVAHRLHHEDELKASLLAEEVVGHRFETIAAHLERTDIVWRPTAVFTLRVVTAALIRGGETTTWHSEPQPPGI